MSLISNSCMYSTWTIIVHPNALCGFVFLLLFLEIKQVCICNIEKDNLLKSPITFQ